LLRPRPRGDRDDLRPAACGKDVDPTRPYRISEPSDVRKIWERLRKLRLEDVRSGVKGLVRDEAVYRSSEFPESPDDPLFYAAMLKGLCAFYQAATSHEEGVLHLLK
jgi:hypothetical protein